MSSWKWSGWIQQTGNPDLCTPLCPAEHHAAVSRHVFERAQEPHAAVPSAAGDADADARVLEPHAQPLPAGGDAAGGRAARLGSAVPGAAHHDGAARPRGEPVRASPIAQGWGGYLKPSGVWIPLGSPSPLPLGPQTTLFSADSTPGGSQSISAGSDSPPEMQTQPRHVQITPQRTPDPSQGARSTSRIPHNTPGASSIPQRVLNIIQRGLDAS